MHVRRTKYLATLKGKQGYYRRRRNIVQTRVAAVFF